HFRSFLGFTPIRRVLLGRWIQPTNPVHGLSARLSTRGIYPEVLLQGIRPTQRLWTMVLLLPQHCKQGSRHPAFGNGASSPKYRIRKSRQRPAGGNRSFVGLTRMGCASFLCAGATQQYTDTF